jgi:rubrerythrin
MNIKNCKNCGDEFTGAKQLCPVCEVEKLRSDSDLNAVSKPGVYKVDDKQGMTATEKIIKGLEICGDNKPSCKGCPYYEFKSPNCLYTLHKEAIDLFFGQQAEIEKQIPKKLDYEDNEAYCPVCGHEFENNINDWGCNYCQGCGQKLDWSDEE